jgi:hypothetical protein
MNAFFLPKWCGIGIVALIVGICWDTNLRYKTLVFKTT